MEHHLEVWRNRPELNGYPGPRHVLDAFEAREFDLTKQQHEQTKALYEKMRSGAIKLGKQIIDIEKEINDAFVNRTIAEEFLQNKVSESANLYSQLRVAHLKYHLSMIEILSPQQVEKYNKLRGYSSGDTLAIISPKDIIQKCGSCIITANNKAFEKKVQDCGLDKIKVLKTLHNEIKGGVMLRLI